MTEDWTRGLESLLDGPSPAVLTTYRQDGTAVTSPVWFRYHDRAFEVVVAQDDVKLLHLARRPRCSLVVFEAVPPFRGVRTDGEPSLHHDGVQAARQEIAGRYLGADQPESRLRSRPGAGEGSGPAMSAEPAGPIHPADAAATAPYEVIHLGGQAAVIVPLAEFLRLRALESATSAQALEDAAAAQDWLAREARGETNYVPLPEVRRRLGLAD